MQWRTSERHRQNDLFDKRYELYMRIRSTYLGQHDGQPLDIEDWIPLAEEANFLFGEDIRKHVLSLNDKEVSGSPFFPDDWFVRPFAKYLTL